MTASDKVFIFSGLLLTLQVMRKTIAFVFILSALCSCKVIENFINDDEVVARVGEDKLYKSELDAYIPDYVAGEDSVRMAEQFMNSWATDKLFLKIAGEQLTSDEMDVSEELENYRTALLKYRYEQHYVNSRLDAEVTEEQIRAYYEEHKADFNLERPVLKLRFVAVMKDSPYREEVLKMVSSEDLDDLERADTIAVSSALRYMDWSDTWKDAAEIAREFGVDYVSMLSRRQGNIIRMEYEETGELREAYILDIRESGAAPVEFCSESIKDIILSARKRSLLSGLEQDLLESALERKDFVIYR